MEFALDDAIAVLRRTPAVLDAWLRGLPDTWVRATEGPGTWSPFEVVGHLIHGEHTDWIPRTRIIIEHGEGRTFVPFDRFAQATLLRDRTLESLLDEFAATRADNLATLEGLRLTPADLARTGRHPELGTVTLAQLLATWVAHDLDHLVQVARVMARRYGDEVGPWTAYLSVLRR
ncbi:MAG: DinB family protein [Candidatus Eisenbacteria bacterium]